MKHVYLDHAAATPLAKNVWKAMLPFLEKEFGNPSAIYHSGRVAKETLQNARENIARILHVSRDEIIFTGSGTESDALAVLGVMHAFGKGHCIVGSTEHHAVLFNAEKLEKEGYQVTYLPVNKEGVIDLQSLRNAIQPDTALVSIMYANNEIGTIAPIKEISKIIKEEREKRKKENNTAPLWFHTDACQAAGYLNLNIENLGVDLMTINGSKIYGPKGVGALYARKGVRIDPLWRGGGQEQKLRSGTQFVAGIVGLARAFEIAEALKDSENERLSELRDYFIARIQKEIPRVVLNGHRTQRLCNNVNVSILDIEGESLLLYLDHEGIEISTGSACDSETLDPSHVILALGKPYEFAHASIRFSMGRSTTKKDIDYVMSILPQKVSLLRSISPVHVDEAATSISSLTAFVGGNTPHWERKKAASKK